MAYNTHFGERTNLAYDDVAVPANPKRDNWYVFNNIFDEYNVISDSDNHILPPNGFCSNNWWAKYAVGNYQNVSLGGSTNGYALGAYSYAGFRFPGKFNVTPTYSGQFVRDASAHGTTAGFGDYHTVSGAQAQNMATSQARKYALDGVVRATNGTGAVGAYA